MPKIADVKSKSRSKRKPLRDVSNGGVKPFSSNSVMKEFNPNTQQQDPVTTCGGGRCRDPLDRLLLVHSDLSVLIRQIDELVVQALEQKVRNKKEIESFAHVLYEMQASLKPWVSRFQKVLSTHAAGSENQLKTSLASKKTPPSINEDISKALDSPDIYKLDFLISPSPLVSWRADGAAEGGRNLFLLTPLPRPTAFSSRLKESSKSVFEKITSDATVGPVAENFSDGIEVKPIAALLSDPTAFSSRLKESSKSVFEKITSDATVGPVAENFNDGVEVKPIAGLLSDPVATNIKGTVESGFSSPEKLARRNDSMVVSTPYLKMSPPKSCILLEPTSECCNKNINGTENPTMHPVGGGGYGDSESCSSQPSGHLALKYPELFGIRPAHKLGSARKVVEASPNWGMSPPKTCILLEPSDDQALSNAVIKDVETNLPKAGGIQSVVSSNEVIGSTPMCKDLDTTIPRGKRPGENTLKKELWTRFEAATTHGFCFKASVDQETTNASTNKGFMDLLEEVSCDDTNSIV